MGQFSPDLSITGADQTGFTTPTYTMVVDFPPDANSKQWAVSALGGTQTGVRAHVDGDPFTVVIRKERYKALPSKNPVNGSYGNVPMNRTELLFRKGVYIDSSQTIRVANLRIIAELPAGCQASDAANVRGLTSFALGLMAEEASDFGDTLITGVVG